MHARRQETSGAVAHAMQLDQLRDHIRTLITLEESEAPLVSSYIPIGRSGVRPDPFNSRVREIWKLLDEKERALFQEPFERILSYLATEVRPATRGVATFARAGTRPFFLGLQFQVPLPDRLSVSSTPDVYHLIELKDTYHRYVVLISTEASARILEVNLGAVTREVWAKRPDLREAVGDTWTHEHYQNHRRDRGELFLKEKIELLDRLMGAGGHTHLILAGSPRMTARIRKRLPKHLLARLFDVVPASVGAREDVVAATLSSFIERKQGESLEGVARLVGALRRGGLAAAGTAATLEALRHGQADVLVMARAYEPGPAWGCKHCGWTDTTTSQPGLCRDCESTEFQSMNPKESMIRLAERQSLEVELVQHSDVLMNLGGVGCLLRYATPDPWQEPVDLGGS